MGGLGTKACFGGVHREPAGVGPEGSDANAWARACAEQYLMAPASRGRRDVFACFYAGLDDPSEDSCVRLVHRHVLCTYCRIPILIYAALVCERMGAPYRCAAPAVLVGPCVSAPAGKWYC